MGQFVPSWPERKNHGQQVVFWTHPRISTLWLQLTLKVFSGPALTSLVVVIVQSLNCVWLFMTPWTAAHQASLLRISQSLLILMYIESGGQSIGASASVLFLPMNIKSWFPLGLTGLISLQSKGLKSLLQHHSSKAWHLFSPCDLSQILPVGGGLFSVPCQDLLF